MEHLQANQNDPNLSGLNRAKSNVRAAARYLAYSSVISFGIFAYIIYMTKVLHIELKQEVSIAFAISVLITVVAFFIRLASALMLRKTIQKAVDSRMIDNDGLSILNRAKLKARTSSRKFAYSAIFTIGILLFLICQREFNSIGNFYERILNILWPIDLGMIIIISFSISLTVTVVLYFIKISSDTELKVAIRDSVDLQEKGKMFVLNREINKFQLAVRIIYGLLFISVVIIVLISYLSSGLMFSHFLRTQTSMALFVLILIATISLITVVLYFVRKGSAALKMNIRNSSELTPVERDKGKGSNLGDSEPSRLVRNIPSSVVQKRVFLTVAVIGLLAAVFVFGRFGAGTHAPEVPKTTPVGDTQAIQASAAQGATQYLQKYRDFAQKNPGQVDLPALIKKNNWPSKDKTIGAAVGVDDQIDVLFKYEFIPPSTLTPERSVVNGCTFTLQGSFTVDDIKKVKGIVEASFGVTLEEVYFERLAKTGIHFNSPISSYPEILVKFQGNGDSGSIFVSVQMQP
jgi:hypothetical protein